MQNPVERLGFLGIRATHGSGMATGVMSPVYVEIAGRTAWLLTS